MTPHRVQRRRTKGYRLPPSAVCVTRGTRWGNPFKVEDYGRAGAVSAYRASLEAMTEIELAEFLEPLWGANSLACWCRLDQPCHADVLLGLLARTDNCRSFTTDNNTENKS